MTNTWNTAFVEEGDDCYWYVILPRSYENYKPTREAGPFYRKTAAEAWLAHVQKDEKFLNSLSTMTLEQFDAYYS